MSDLVQKIRGRRRRKKFTLSDPPNKLFIIMLAISTIVLMGFITVDYNIEMDKEKTVQVSITAIIDKEAYEGAMGSERSINDETLIDSMPIDMLAFDKSGSFKKKSDRAFLTKHKNEREEQLKEPLSASEVKEYIDKYLFLHLKSESGHDYQYEVEETDDEIFVSIFATDLAEINGLDPGHFNAFSIGGASGSHTRVLPFYEKTTHSVMFEIPIESIEGYVDQSFLNKENIDIHVNVTLPYNITEHNGHFDGHTVTWSIDPAKQNNLHITYVKQELIKPIVFIVAVIGAILVFYLRKKYKKSNL